MPLAIFDNCFGGILLHLYSLDEHMAFVVRVVVEKHASIKHYRVVLLCDLVSLREIWVVVVLAVKLNVVRDAARQSQTAADCFVEAIFVQYRKHSWKTQVDVVGVGVWLFKICAKGS